MKYFALIWEDLSNTWSYFIQDYDSLEELQSDIEESLKEGHIHPFARIDIYKGEHVEVKLERPE